MNELIKKSSINELCTYLPEHKEMIENIQKNMPEIVRSTSLFSKTQSQFMDNMLTTSHPTPIRNLRQLLAEIEKARMALVDVQHKNKKKKLEIEMKQAEMDELQSQLEETDKYISGAIRKIANHVEQYNSILAAMGKTSFNEIDFEEEEERYHIMKAFDQALIAARSRQGVIDEGNHIYFCQIGINGASAQMEISKHLQKEGKLLIEGKQPEHKLILDFLNDMADKYKGCSKVLAEHKGMSSFTESAALKEGDRRGW